MYYIGTSLGKCLKSILQGEVSEDEVLLVITSTRCDNYDSYANVVDSYYHNGNRFVGDPEKYKVNNIDENDYKSLAQRLWDNGKIHQPHLSYQSNWLHVGVFRNQTWLQVVPTIDNTTPAVVDAYEKYKLLDSLTKNE